MAKPSVLQLPPHPPSYQSLLVRPTPLLVKLLLPLVLPLFRFMEPPGLLVHPLRVLAQLTYLLERPSSLREAFSLPVVRPPPLLAGVLRLVRRPPLDVERSVLQLRLPLLVVALYPRLVCRPPLVAAP